MKVGEGAQRETGSEGASVRWAHHPHPGRVYHNAQRSNEGTDVTFSLSYKIKE